MYIEMENVIKKKKRSNSFFFREVDIVPYNALNISTQKFNWNFINFNQRTNNLQKKKT